MPFNELSPLQREMYLKLQIENLVKLYKGAQFKLAMQLRKVDLTDFQRYRAEALLKQVNEIVGTLNNGVYKWAKDTIPYSYERGIDLAGERLKALGTTRFVSYDAKIHTSSISALVDDVTLELITANTSMGKFFNRVIRQTQQSLLQDAEISKMIAEGLIEGQARRTVSDEVLKGLREQLGKQQYIVINGRNYRPDSYASLIARTRTREASSQGTINTALRYGVDLVQWDAHAEVCEYCAQFSGRVYSISGADNDFPMLTEKPPLHPNSYDKDTEIYTARGWVNIKDIVVEDKCLSLNINSLNLEWSGIKQLFRHYENKMISFNNRVFDLLVTHNHSMLYTTDWNHKHNKGKLNFIEAKKLLGKKSGSFYRSSEWNGELKEHYQLGDKKVTPELYAEFMGWFLSEGCIVAGRNAISISQSDKVNNDKYCRIEELLKNIGIKYHKKKDGFHCYNKELYNQLLPFGKSFEKYIPEDIKSATQNIIKVFLDAFIAGDGHIREGSNWKGGNFNEERQYFTSSKRMADDLGELIIKIGRRPSFHLDRNKDKWIKFRNGTYKINHNLWRISECYAQYASLCNMEIKEIDYKDYSYCVELEKNHTLWVRRNGKTCWCGNCRCVIAPITRNNLEARGYLNEVIKLSNAPSIKIDSFSRFEEVLSQL